MLSPPFLCAVKSNQINDLGVAIYKFVFIIWLTRGDHGENTV